MPGPEPGSGDRREETGRRFARRPPDIEAWLETLASHGVRYVVIGSSAARLHGLEIEPRDLDVAPDPDPPNLARLIAALESAGAWPIPSAGHWERDATGERVWAPEDGPSSEVATWRPDPGDVATLDSVFTSRFGDLDVVPDLSGTFHRLDARAQPRHAGAVEARVAHVDDLLAALTVPRRARDADRVRALRDLQRREGMGRT